MKLGGWDVEGVVGHIAVFLFTKRETRYVPPKKTHFPYSEPQGNLIKYNVDETVSLTK